MLINRFFHHGLVHYGLVEPESEFFRVLSGNIFERFEITTQKVRREEATILSPVTPRIIIGVGRNYRNHLAEIGESPPDRPAIFFKPSGTMIAHEQPILIPSWATQVDYEGELGVVVGRKMKNVGEADVPDHIFGCTCFNDVTERHVGSSGLINQDISKCCDTFGPCGPWISTDIDPDNTELKTRLNGEVVQHDTTANTVFGVKRIVSELSFFMTLEPGDLVITGTPGGIGPLQVGDTVEVDIEGIGRLSNPVQTDGKQTSDKDILHA